VATVFRAAADDRPAAVADQFDQRRAIHSRRSLSVRAPPGSDGPLGGVRDAARRFPLRRRRGRPLGVPTDGCDTAGDADAAEQRESFADGLGLQRQYTSTDPDNGQAPPALFRSLSPGLLPIVQTWNLSTPAIAPRAPKDRREEDAT
jgi:hypothetical protein